MSGGTSHITDATNASRTQLCNITTASWDEELLEIFRVPIEALPQIVPNFGLLAQVNPDCFLKLSVPITGMAGDQQAALIGQGAVTEGASKCTYGTGAFLLVNTGRNLVKSNHGLLTTIAFQDPSGHINYALEGSVFVAGSAVQWLRDELKLISKSKDIEPLANSVEDSSSVVFVPALTGLGAPWWKPEVTGTIFGITRGTKSAHIARATLEAVAFQVTDLIEALDSDFPGTLNELRVDGGMAENNLFLQIQSNACQKTVIRAGVSDSTALGAAYLAGLGVGLFKDLSEISRLWIRDQTFSPIYDIKLHQTRWRKAVETAVRWSESQ
jgi:glycerol kinase